MERTELRERARRQFDAEGSDKDKDWLRDPVESGEGTKADNPDSDNDGLGDAVEIQLRNAGVTTSQDSTPDDTTDLDAARERIGERRTVSDAPPQSSSATADGASELAASDPLTSDVLEAPSYDAASLAADIAPVETASYEDTDAESNYAADDLAADVGGAADGFTDGSSDAWA